MQRATSNDPRSGPELERALRSAATQLRRLVLRMTSAAGSGHPTTCLSAADLAAVLFFHVLRYDVRSPANPHNDRFVLSKGHAAPLLYAAWAEAGAFAPEALAGLRTLTSDLEGHPTPRFAWAEIATGSLGQGLSSAVGMALAARLDGLAYRVYALLGDGETAEGSVWEAAALAAHRRLANLVAIVDVNRLGQSDPTMLGHDVAAHARRFEAFGWHAITIDGHDIGAIVDAFAAAEAVVERPVAIVARTLKGKGVSFLEDAEGWHGKALDAKELGRALDELSLEGAALHYAMRSAPRSDGPRAARRPPAVTRGDEPTPEYAQGEQVATRTAYGTALAKLGARDSRVVVLDGDVKNSTKAETFAERFPDRFIESFIAEQNMVGMAVGLQAHGKIPFVSTFACFLTRAFDQVRMAAIGRANVKLCGSHAGVSIGEDGPSQMGLEDLAMMRSVPGAVVLYPSDAVAMERMVHVAAATPGIVYLRSTRPKTPVLYGPHDRFEIGGCCTLRSSVHDRLTIVAAGVTVHEALRAHELLWEGGIAVRVVDCYSVQPIDRATLLLCAAETNNLLLTVEDHYLAGGLGEAVLGAVGSAGVRVQRLAVRGLPRSGAGERLLEAHGIGAQSIAAAVRDITATLPRAGTQALGV